MMSLNEWNSDNLWKKSRDAEGGQVVKIMLARTPDGDTEAPVLFQCLYNTSKKVWKVLHDYVYLLECYIKP